MAKINRATLILLLLIAVAACGSKTHYDRLDLVTQIHNAHKGKWFKHLTVTKKIQYYKNGEEASTDNWYQAISHPTRMHMKNIFMDSGLGNIYKDDSVYRFNNNILRSAAFNIPPILLLTHGIYFLEPDSTKQKLMHLGCSYDNTHITDWNGKRTYVMGTVKEGDLSKIQFWFDEENMLLVRAIMRSDKSSNDVHLNNYKQVDGNWIPGEIVFYRDSIKLLKQEYTEIVFPDSLSDDFFDTEKFKETKW